MNLQTFRELVSVFKRRRVNLLPNELSGCELRRTKAGGVDHSGIMIGTDVRGQTFVVERAPNGVQIVPYESFASGQDCTSTDPILGPARSVENALSRLGESGYDPIRNNCQHFSTWAAHGEAKSSAVLGAGIAVAVAAAFLLAIKSDDDRT